MASRDGISGPITKLEKFWLISLYLTDEAIACEVKFRQIEGNGLKVRQIEGNGLKVRQIELSNSVTDELYTNSAEAVQPNNSALLKGQCHDILTHNLFFFGETAHLHP